jgi:hypothetical protein
MAEVQDLELQQEIGELEAVEQELQQAETQQEPQLPEKYRGKSVEDIIKMHQEAEKLIDRQGREVGEVRKLADELIKSQLHKKPEVEQPVEIDFFENPQEAIRLAVENNPKVKAAEQYTLQIQREKALQQLNQLHPDYAQIVQDSEFADWVRSNRIRMQLFQQAEGYDVDAADQLLGAYKLLQQAKQRPVSEVETKARKQTLNQAAVDTGGSGETGKRVFRRVDLLNLRLRDPRKYEAMQDEIDRAYQEGRVK